LVPHIRHTRNSRVDPLRLSAEVRVKSAKNDPSMVAAPVSMEIQKVATIVRQQYPTFGNRQRQNLRMGTAAFALPESSEVNTSCPRRLNSVTTCSAMFSLE
jgi:hypothetical protein